MSDPAVVAPMTMGQLARMVGWHPRRMKRRLLKLHAANGDSLLVRVGGHWMTTVASLRNHWPEFGALIASGEDVREVRELAERHEREIERLAKAVIAVDRKSETRMKCLELRVRAVETLAYGMGQK